MKVGAYQFAVTNDIKHNLKIVKKAIIESARTGIKFLAFPECALTGYPPRDIENSAAVDFDELAFVYEQLQKLADENEISIMVGTIVREDEKYYNSAIFFAPYKEKRYYHKKALWGWDKDNFSAGNRNGIFEIDGWKIGVRICFEVRFPEIFRELYREHTDLNVIMLLIIMIWKDMN